MSAGQVVAAMAADDACWLGRWRTLPGFEACEAENRVWVRGAAGPAWTYLPALERYTEDEVGRLVRPGERVPRRRLPEGQWLPIVEWLRVRPPAAALPALHVAPVAWTLQPATEFRTPSLLILPFASLASWVLTAAAVRLSGLRFALGEDGRACVRGGLLPSLPGESWCLEQSIATPAGWALPQGITAQLVSTVMKLEAGELALLHPDATAESLHPEAFVDATRSSIRACLRAPN